MGSLIEIVSLSYVACTVYGTPLLTKFLELISKSVFKNFVYDIYIIHCAFKIAIKFCVIGTSQTNWEIFYSCHLSNLGVRLDEWILTHRQYSNNNNKTTTVKNHNTNNDDEIRIFILLIY